MAGSVGDVNGANRRCGAAQGAVVQLRGARRHAKRVAGSQMKKISPLRIRNFGCMDVMMCVVCVCEGVAG